MEVSDTVIDVLEDWAVVLVIVETSTVASSSRVEIQQNLSKSLEAVVLKCSFDADAVPFSAETSELPMEPMHLLHPLPPQLHEGDLKAGV